MRACRIGVRNYIYLSFLRNKTLVRYYFVKLLYAPATSISCEMFDTSLLYCVYMSYAYQSYTGIHGMESVFVFICVDVA